MSTMRWFHRRNRFLRLLLSLSSLLPPPFFLSSSLLNTGVISIARHPLRDLTTNASRIVAPWDSEMENAGRNSATKSGNGSISAWNRVLIAADMRFRKRELKRSKIDVTPGASIFNVTSWLRYERTRRSMGISRVRLIATFAEIWFDSHDPIVKGRNRL